MRIDTIRDALQNVEVVIQTLGVNFAPKFIFEGTTLFSGSTLQPTHRVLLNDLRSAWCAQRAVSRIVLIRADVNRPYARSGSRRLMFDVLGDHIVPGQYARMERGSSIATR